MPVVLGSRDVHTISLQNPLEMTAKSSQPNDTLSKNEYLKKLVKCILKVRARSLPGATERGTVVPFDIFVRCWRIIYICNGDAAVRTSSSDTLNIIRDGKTGNAAIASAKRQH